MWKINDINISERFGVYLKKGAYNSILSLPSVKPYLTEDLRDNNGESVLVRDVRKCARSVSIPFYMIADDQMNLWAKYDAFVSFLTQESTLDFYIVNHNRNYRFVYEGCSDFSKLKPLNGSGKKYCEFTLSFREPNTDNVTKEDVLVNENGQSIFTEDSQSVSVNVGLY